MKNNITDKPTLQKKVEVVKPPPVKEDLSKFHIKTINEVIDEIENNPVSPKDILPKTSHHWNKLKDEHPKLAIMYNDLNNLVDVAGRSSGLNIAKEREIDNQRKAIRNYEIVNNITRADHIRWSGF